MVSELADSESVSLDEYLKQTNKLQIRRSFEIKRERNDTLGGAALPICSPTSPIPPHFDYTQPCTMCGKHHHKIHMHHTIPRYMDGGDEDIIPLCPSCHRIAEATFERFILDPYEKGRGMPQYNSNPFRQHDSRCVMKRRLRTEKRTRTVVSIDLGEHFFDVLSVENHSLSGRVNVVVRVKSLPYDSYRAKEAGSTTINIPMSKDSVDGHDVYSTYCSDDDE